MRQVRNFRDRLLPALMGGVLIAAAPLAAAEAPRLADAAQKQDIAALRALIRDKADVNAPQIDGATALSLRRLPQRG